MRGADMTTPEGRAGLTARLNERKESTMAITTNALARRIMFSRTERRTVPSKYWDLYDRGARLKADEDEMTRRGFSIAPGHVGEAVR